MNSTQCHLDDRPAEVAEEEVAVVVVEDSLHRSSLDSQVVMVEGEEEDTLVLVAAAAEAEAGSLGAEGMVVVGTLNWVTIEIAWSDITKTITHEIAKTN